MPLQETLTTPGWPLWSTTLLLPSGIGLQAAALVLQRRTLQWLGAAFVLLLALADRDITLAVGQTVALLLLPTVGKARPEDKA